MAADRGVPNVTDAVVMDDLVAARRRVAELEAELREGEDELLLQDDRIEDLRTQLEQADLLLKEGGEARLALQQRVDELEDSMTPAPDLPTQDEQRRNERLEEMLFDAEQELAAAVSIIGKQDMEIADLKFLLDLEEAARRMLERRLTEAENSASRATRPAIPPVSKEPAAAPPRGYPPGYQPNPVVEAMIAAARASGKR